MIYAAINWGPGCFILTLRRTSRRRRCWPNGSWRARRGETKGWGGSRGLPKWTQGFFVNKAQCPHELGWNAGFTRVRRTVSQGKIRSELSVNIFGGLFFFFLFVVVLSFFFLEPCVLFAGPPTPNTPPPPPHQAASHLRGPSALFVFLSNYINSYWQHLQNTFSIPSSSTFNLTFRSK